MAKNRTPRTQDIGATDNKVAPFIHEIKTFALKPLRRLIQFLRILEVFSELKIPQLHNE